MLFYVSHSWSSPSSDNYVSVSWINSQNSGSLTGPYDQGQMSKSMPISIALSIHRLISGQEVDEENAPSVLTPCTSLSAPTSLLEFRLAGRSTVTPMHWLLLGFWGEVCNPRFITYHDLFQKLVAVILLPLQKCQCWFHTLWSAFWYQLLWHHLTHNFLNSRWSVKLLCNKDRKMTAEFRNCEATILQKVVRNNWWPPTAILSMYMLSTCCKLSAPATHMLMTLGP